MVSVFPELRPQARRSEIRSKMATLRSLAGKKTFDGEALGEVIEWL